MVSTLLIPSTRRQAWRLPCTVEVGGPAAGSKGAIGLRLAEVLPQWLSADEVKERGSSRWLFSFGDREGLSLTEEERSRCVLGPSVTYSLSMVGYVWTRAT